MLYFNLNCRHYFDVLFNRFEEEVSFSRDTVKVRTSALRLLSQGQEGKAEFGSIVSVALKCF